MRWPTLVLAAVVAAACTGPTVKPSTAPTSTLRPTPAPTLTVAVAAPAAAILGDADVPRLPRTGGSDRLTLEEWAAAAPDQVVALQEYRAWGWSAAAHRSWGAGGAGVDDLVVLSDRVEGARRAYAYLAQQAARAPLAAGPCPAAITGLDECTLAAAGPRTVVVGRLGPEAFRVDVTGADGVALGAAQAARLRAT